jgi:hypothetical protein
MLKDLEDRIDAVEECYEFMLAYAAQGLEGNEPNAGNIGQLRHLLIRSIDAMTGIADAVRKEDLQPAERHEPFLKVLDRDANDSVAAVEMVLAQPAISSQLIDNLNASIHLRALLTDLFLLDEIVKLHSRAANAVLESSDVQ